MIAPGQIALWSHPLVLGACLSTFASLVALCLAALAWWSSAASRYLLLLSAFVMMAVAFPLLFIGSRISLPILPAPAEQPLPVIRLTKAPASPAQGAAPAPLSLPSSQRSITMQTAKPAAEMDHSRPELSITALFFWVWGVPVFLLFCVLLAGSWRVSTLKRNSQPLHKGAIWKLFQSLCAEHHIKNVPELLTSEKMYVPFVCGIMRPVIILPAESQTWPSEVARSILLHELAHVVRKDVACAVLAQVVASLYWFNPFAWICLARLRAQSEMAADDFAVTRIANADDYADSLLSQVRRLRNLTTWHLPAAGVLRNTGIEGRIKRILDRTAARRSPNAIRCVAVLATAIFCGVILALVQPTPVEASLKAPAAGGSSTYNRGRILDRNGEILADSIVVGEVTADGSRIKDRAATAAILSKHLQTSETEILARIHSDRVYNVVAREISQETATACANELKENGLTGIHFLSKAKRVYSSPTLLTQTLGLYGQDFSGLGNGVSGVERTLNSYLAEFPGNENQAARAGADVTLTIDVHLQRILESELAVASDQLKPESITGIIIDPKSGQILAMSSLPSFDRNALATASARDITNRAIMDIFEPGSPFKLVAAAASLNEGKVNADTEIYCENGRFLHSGVTLRDAKPHGMLSVSDILAKSSNVGAAKLALLVGDDKYYEYVSKFGFGVRTGIELPGEAIGLVHPPSHWDKLTLTRMAMGQSIAATPLQTLMAMTVVANGGKLLRPTIIRSVTDPVTGEKSETQPSATEVISTTTAETLRQALARSFSENYHLAMPAAGLSGTAQKADIQNGGYLPGRYIASFTGFLPADAPRLACIIIIDDAKVDPAMNYGSLLAAPVFMAIGNKSIDYINLTKNKAAAR